MVTQESIAVSTLVLAGIALQRVRLIFDEFPSSDGVYSCINVFLVLFLAFMPRFVLLGLGAVPSPTPGTQPTRKPTSKPTGTPIGKPTTKPTPANIVPATPAPTFPCNLTPEERERQITQLMETVSDPDDLARSGSPQQKSLDWLIMKDAMQACPTDDMIIQRYVMAVFYYSTNGDSWKNCNAPEDFNSEEDVAKANDACTLSTTNSTQIFPNDIRGTNAWLSPQSECTWGGLSWLVSPSFDSVILQTFSLLYMVPFKHRQQTVATRKTALMHSTSMRLKSVRVSVPQIFYVLFFDDCLTKFGLDCSSLRIKRRLWNSCV